MRSRRVQGGHERQVLIAMIVNRPVLSAVSAKWEPGMFSSKWANIIGGWCVKHFRQYKKPPGKDIVTIFEDWSEAKERDKETVQLIDKFLASLSAEYASLKKELNVDYIMDLAGNYFTKVKQKQLGESIIAAVEEGNLTEVEELVQKYSKVDVSSSEGTDLFAEPNVMEKAFDAKREPLITYEHGLGVFYGDALERDGFIAFMGMEKVGKTWCLMDVAWTAILQHKKVAFFEVGDLSRDQVVRRFAVRAAQVPMKPRVVSIPTNIIYDEEAGPIVNFEEKKFKKGLDYSTAWEAMQLFIKKNKIEPNALRISTHPNSSISILGVQSIIDSWERQGWVPDVVIIDYADILEPISGQVDSRDQINATWKKMRAMSQEYHCLVVTATQVKASAYEDETLGKMHFSEDKRKFAHVTGMVGLNQTNKDKRAGVVRYNWTVLREEEFIETQCCYVAPCLSLGTAVALSVMP